jgi:uncharacterized protein (TIGR03118 family)
MSRLATVSLVSLLVLAGCASDHSPSAAIASALAATPAPAAAATARRFERDQGPYVVRRLVSDGFVEAEHLDPSLVNPWGLTHLPTSPWWVSDNGSNSSTLYDADGIAQFGSPPLVVQVTGAGGSPGDPSGVVANGTTSFVVTSGGASGPARFLFASEDGTISGWNPGVPPPLKPAPRSTMSIVAVDNSSPDPLGGAVYKGLALASTSAGDRLYATNFRQGRIDVFDGSFMPVAAPGDFVDPGIPKSFAPFGIQLVGAELIVTYAKQDAFKHDDVAGPHLGYVSAFETDGDFIRRVATRGRLNSPWGIAVAPANFGALSGDLLIGNFGDGHIIAYRHDRAREEGAGRYLTTRRGPVTIDGLWGIAFGNDSAAGPANALFFTAGTDAEAHGLFGRIDVGEGHPDGDDD